MSVEWLAASHTSLVAQMCNKRVNDAFIVNFDCNLWIVTFFGKRDGNICKGPYYRLRLAPLHTSLEAIAL